MKRSRLERRTPLRRTALKPISKRKRKADAGYYVIRAQVLARDDGRCVVCGKLGSHTHHVLYRSQGGKHTLLNLVTLCGTDHDRVHAEGPAVWRETLLEIARVRSAIDGPSPGGVG